MESPEMGKEEQNTDFLLDSSVGIHFKGKTSGSHPSVEGGYVFTGSQKII